MNLIITKETPDLRENRSKILKVGTRLTVTVDLANKYIKAKVAKCNEPLIKVRNPIKSESELEQFLEEKNEE